MSISSNLSRVDSFYGSRRDISISNNANIGSSSINSTEKVPNNETEKEAINKIIVGHGLILEDFFPYNQNTFCMISKKFKQTLIYRFSSSKSLFLFSPFNKFRLFCLQIFIHRAFDLFIFLIIILNCIFMGVTSNHEEIIDGKGTGKMIRDEPLFTRYFEFFFLTVYTLEMIIKVVGRGFLINKFSYLRNGWNCFDFLCLTFGYASVFLYIFLEDEKSDEYEFFRTVRVLRTIKSISILPGLRTMTNSLLRSMYKLLEVITLTFFIICIFSLIGVQFFMGKLTQKCVLNQEVSNDTNYLYQNESENFKNWKLWIKDENNWIKRTFPREEYLVCSNETFGRNCPDGYSCLAHLGDNPDWGWTNFDNFFFSLLSTFQMITLDYWERLYDLIMSSVGPLSLTYFIMVIFLGSLFLLNLMLSVVILSYEKEVHHEEDNFISNYHKLENTKYQSRFEFANPQELVTKVYAKNRKEPSPIEREEIAKKLGKFKTESSIRRYSLMSSKIKIGSSATANKPVMPNELDKEKNNEKSNKREKLKVKRSGKICTFLKIKFHKMKMPLEPIAESVLFDFYIILCIIFNTILFATEHYQQSNFHTELLNGTNQFITVTFTIEMFLKLLAFQKDFFKSSWNIFDMIIVITSIGDLILELFSSKDSVNVNLIRGLRLLRVFRLAQSWMTMKILLNIIFSTFKATGYLILILVINIYVFAILGMDLVGSGYNSKAFNANNPNDLEFPKWHFLNFGYAFLMVFRVLCGEWIEPLWDCLQAQTPDKELHKDDGRFKCFLIFIPIVVIGNFVILNLFLALLLDRFNTEEIKAQRDKEVESKRIKENLRKMAVHLFSDNEEEKPIPKTEEIWPSNFKQQNLVGKNEDLRKRVAAANKSHTSAESKEKVKASSVKINDKVEERILEKYPENKEREKKNSNDQNAEGEEEEEDTKSEDEKDLWQSSGQFKSFLSQVVVDRKPSSEEIMMFSSAYPENDITRKKSSESDEIRRQSALSSYVPKMPGKKSFLRCCPRFIRKNLLKNPEENIEEGEEQVSPKLKAFRKYVGKIMEHWAFQYMIIVFILVSSIILCFEDSYLEEKKDLQDILFHLNIIFTLIFTIELILIFIVNGFWNSIKDFWIIFETFLVIVNLVTLVFFIRARLRPSMSSVNMLNQVKIFRAFRPLKIIPKWKSMKIIFRSLLYSFPRMFNVCLVCLLFWLVFAIMGVQLFKGKFYKCIFKETGKKVPYDIIQNREQCCDVNLSDNFTWVNSLPNFDNVMEGYLSLFQIATFEGWMEIIENSVDSNDIDLQPIRNHRFVYYTFFVVFIVFGSFYTLNLFVGVVIDNYNFLKRKNEGTLFEVLMTYNQRSYYIIMNKLAKKKPKAVIPKRKNFIISFCYDIAISKRFEIAIFVIIILNMFIVAFEYDRMGKMMTSVLNALDCFFISIYIIEAAIKIIGLQHYYFKAMPWNIFDFFLVIASLIDLFYVIDSTSFKFNIQLVPTLLRVIRIYRIARVVRLFKSLKGIRKLLVALIVSLPALLNIIIVLLLITFVYAIVGMDLFGQAAQYGAIDDVFNFKTFLQSFLVLIRLMTVAGWNEILDGFTQIENIGDCSQWKKITCGGYDEPDCVSRCYAIAYTVSYIIICNQIVINMYIAVILGNYEEATREEESGIDDADLDMFYRIWAKFDPHAVQFISFDQLSDLLDLLDPPFYYPKPNMMTITSFNFPIYKGNRVHCTDVLIVLIDKIFGDIETTDDFLEVKDKINQNFAKTFPLKQTIPIVSSSLMWKIRDNAAITIQRAWRKYLAKKKEQMNLNN